MKVLAAYNIKGGVGKTSTAVNLAWLSAASGSRTLICDLDPQGAATWCFRVKMKIRGRRPKKLVRGTRALARHVRETDYEGLDLLPADFSYRHLDLLLDSPKYVRRLTRRIRELGAGYDYVFLDCAPGISLASEAVFAVADALIVPTIPTTLSRRTLRQLARHLRREPGGGPRAAVLLDGRSPPDPASPDLRSPRRDAVPHARDRDSVLERGRADELAARAVVRVPEGRAEAARAYAALWRRAGAAAPRSSFPEPS